MTTAPKPRVPYADRPEVIREFCTCRHEWQGDDSMGEIVRLVSIELNPTCPLHGEHVEQAPF